VYSVKRKIEIVINTDREMVTRSGSWSIGKVNDMERSKKAASE